VRSEVLGGDCALGFMVIILAIEGYNGGEVRTNGGNMVSNNIKHDPYSGCVGCIYEVLQILGGSKFRIYLLPVGSPVSMVATWRVHDNWRNPNGIKAHSGDVVQVVLETFPVTPTISAEIITWRGVARSLSKSIGQDLIDRSLLPVSCLSR